MSNANKRVAIVVFLTVEDSDDLGTSQWIAEDAVRQALAAAGTRNGRSLTLRARHTDGSESTTTVNGHMELGRAMRGGYVWAHPTADAYPRETP